MNPKENYNLVNSFVESYYYSPAFRRRLFHHMIKHPLKFDTSNYWRGQLPYEVPKLTVSETSPSLYNLVYGITINPNQSVKGFPTQRAIMAHELGHYVDDKVSSDFVFSGDYSGTYPIFRKNSYLLKLIKTAHPADRPYLINRPNIFEWSGIYHDALPSESYADLMSFRYLLYNHKIYDSRKANHPFTAKHLLQFKKINPNFRLFKYFTDELIVQMMNEVAQNNTDLTTDYEIT